MQKIATLGAIAALGMGGAAFAAEGPSYSYVEAGYGITDVQVPGASAGSNGFVVAGSLELPNNFFVKASFNDRSYDDDLGFDETELSAGAGYKWSLSDSVDMFAAASFESLKLDPDGGSSADDTGFGLSIGVRTRATEKLELNSFVKYTDIELEGTSVSGFEVGAGGRYYFTPNFAGGVDVVADKVFIGFSQVGFMATLRYDFGKVF